MSKRDRPKRVPVEEWKPVRGWVEFYEVSSHGRFRSLPRRDGAGRHRGARMLAPRRQVTLVACGWYERVTVARIVAETFVPNPKGYGTLVRRDGDRDNAAATNLRWVAP